MSRPRSVKKRQAAKSIPAIRTTRTDVLGWLLGRRSISPAQHAAGVIIRALWAARGGGSIKGNPFLQKVDGGGHAAEELIRLGVIRADRRLRQLFAEADIGVEAIEVVIRACGEGEGLDAIACDFEHNPDRPKDQGASTEARAEVRRLLRNGLTGIANVAHGRSARGGRIRSGTIRAWLGEGSRPKINGD